MIRSESFKQAHRQQPKDFTQPAGAQVLPGWWSGKLNLLTSLPQKKLSFFRQLYFRRWGVETGIDFARNVLQLENFSSKTVLGVRQDFEAHMLAVDLQRAAGG